MIPTIKFNKEEIENYIRKEIEISLTGKKNWIYIHTPLLRWLVVSLCSTLFAVFISFVGCFNADLTLGPIIISIGIGISLGTLLFCVNNWREYRAAKEAYKKYTSIPNPNLEDLFSWYKDICSWTIPLWTSEISKKYKQYEVLNKISSVEILEVEYPQSPSYMTFTYAEDNGDIATIDIDIDENKQNLNIDNDTLLWEDGKVVYTEKYVQNEAGDDHDTDI